MSLTLKTRDIVYATAAFSLAATIAGTALAETKLVYAGYISERSISTALDAWFMDEVEKRSEGDITFERYYGGSLMKAPDIYPGLARGAVDFATGVPQAYNPKVYPLSNVVLPWITEKADAVVYAFRDLYAENPDLQKEFSSQGVKMMWALPFPDGGIWGDFPVHEPDDMAGKRIRAVAAIAWGVEAGGGSPVPMSFADAVEAVNRHAIDAMANTPFDSAVNNGVPKVVAYASDAGRLGINSVSIASMNQKSWDKLTDDQKKIVTEVAAEVPGHYVELINAAIAKAAQRFIDEGATTEVILSTDEEAAAWKAKMGPIMREKFIEQASAVTENGGALYDQFVALVSKYEPEAVYTPGLATYVKMKAGE
ncbi:TRAP transporter substrate-binding protein [Chachezhania sediminis]|uniref:TRAP transporter substrate-binding protein n=1 Tax=Chachezhania sediminis TaxID=2599291 RepID=UPI00131B889A|nr:TRAP transporter substrate-binding protein DctP [Chachezhania sediminis]